MRKREGVGLGEERERGEPFNLQGVEEARETAKTINGVDKNEGSRGISRKGDKN